MRVPGKRGRRSGYLLLGNVLVVFLMTTAALGFIAMMQRSMVSVFKASEVAACSRASQTAFARLRSIDLYSLFALDSASTDYGLWAAYPHKAVLDGVRVALSNARFDRYRVTQTPMRRDASLSGKRVTVEVYRRGRLVCSQTGLVPFERMARR
ncbi:MAG: hypothetical protein HY928_11825 [Elusimicrobia bacterium]|nr:hypothetical protein [Elusimicrobiota bacterium]